MFDGTERTAPEGAALTALASAAALIEDRVVAIGGDLDEALAILGRQTDTFEALTADLGGDDAAMAAANLGGAMAQIGQASLEHERASATLLALAGEVCRLTQRARALGALAKHAMTLALYMRLEGARIVDDGGEFLVFAESARRATERMKAGLQDFAAEIASVSAQVDAASKDSRAFAGHHQATLVEATARLGANFSALRNHRQHVQACGGQVAARSRDMREQVGQAVLALQIGDTTRQRLEHTHETILLVAELPGGVGSRLVAEQLADTVAEFSRQVGSVAGAFRAMAADAEGIVSLGASARGPGAHTEPGGLLARVQTDMQGVVETLPAMQAARKTSREALHSVLRCIAILRKRVGIIHEMQAELHIMGLNITLKCGRLGQAGTSIGAITQDMRACSRRMEEEAAATVKDLAALTHIAEGAAGTGAGADTQDAAPADDLAPETLIATALSTLSAIDTRVDAALSALAQDGETVVSLLKGGASAIAVEAEITRLADAALAAIPAAPAAAEAPEPADAAILARVFGLYTMVRERDVHRAALGEAPVREPEVSADADVDDLLF